MFDSAELGQSVSKSEFKERERDLRARLLTLQYRSLELARFPVLIDFAGVDGAGKGSTVNMLNKWMDPRWLRSIGYQLPTEEERARPRFWRYWRNLPPKGRIGLYLSGRYSRPLLGRVYGGIDELEFDRRLAEIIRFENELFSKKAIQELASITIVKASLDNIFRNNILKMPVILFTDFKGNANVIAVDKYFRNGFALVRTNQADHVRFHRFCRPYKNCQE